MQSTYQCSLFSDMCLSVHKHCTYVCVHDIFSGVKSSSRIYRLCVGTIGAVVVVAVRSGYINSSCFALLVCSTMNLNAYINPSVAANDQGDQSRTVTIKL